MCCRAHSPAPRRVLAAFYPKAQMIAPSPPLEELFAAHAPAIAALRAELGEGALPPPWDDLWLLRYVLSFDTAAERAPAVRECLAYRAAHAPMLAAAATGAPAPFAAALEPWMVAGEHGVGHNGEPVFIVRAGLSNARGAMGAVAEAELVQFLMYWKERAFLHCDRESRARGRLVKQLVLLDMAGASFATFDMRHLRALGAAGKLSEVVYPQLLGRSVGVHPPAFLATVRKMMAPFMSKKQLEKQSFCPGAAAAGPPSRSPASACPFASRLLDVATLPTFLGGACTCTALGGCVCGRANADTAPVPTEGRGAPLAVPARGALERHVTARRAGDTLRWAARVEDKGVELSAWLTPDGAEGGGGGARVELLAARKLKAEDGRVAGECVVPAAGCVTLRLDNSYSWIMGKTVTLELRMEGAADGGARGE